MGERTMGGRARRAVRDPKAALSWARVRLGLSPGASAVRAAYAAYRAHDFARAAELFTRATSIWPENPMSWLSLARAQRNLRQLEASERSALRALELRPGWPAAIWHLAYLAARGRRPADCVAWLDRLGLLEELGDDDLRRAGETLLRAGAHERALQVAEAVLARAPGDEDATYIRATALGHLGRIDPAAWADEVIQSGVTAARGAVLRWLVEVGDLERAVGLVDQAPDPDGKLRRNVARGLARAGYEAYERREDGRAEAYFLRAVELDATSAALWLALARVQRNLGRPRESESSAGRALGLRPGWPAALWHLAHLAAREGRGAACAAALDQLRPVDRLPDDDLRRVSRLLLRTHEYERALHAAEAVLARAPDDEDAVCVRAVALGHLGRADPATWAEDVLRSGDERARRPVLRWLVEFGEADRALRALETTRTTDGSLLLAMTQRMSELRTRDASDLACFRQAVELEPTNARAWLALARAQRSLGHGQASAASARTALELEPGWPAALWHLADLAAHERRADHCVALLEAIGPWPQLDSGSLRRAGRLLHRAGAMEPALQVAETLLDRSPADEDGLLLRTAALSQLGRRDPSRWLDDVLASGDAGARRAVIRWLVEAGEVERALALLDHVPDDARLLVRLSAALRNAGRLRAALGLLDRAAAVAPREPGVAQLRALVAGELRVLTGAWAPPRFEATPRWATAPGRVLHVVGKSLPHAQAGYTLRTQLVAEAQRVLGLDAQVMTQAGFPWTHGAATTVADVEDVSGVVHHRLRVEDGLPVTMDAQLDRRVSLGAGVVERVRPAVLHAASDFLNAEAALTWGQRYGLPVVYEVRGFWGDTWLSGQTAAQAEAADRYVGRQARETASMLAADRVVTLAPVMRDQILAWGIDAEKVVVVPNAVDAERFHPVGRDPNLARQWGVRDDETTVGYISSFTNYEGIAHLIDAVGHLVAAGRQVKAVLVGDGAERGALEAQAERLGIADRVVFTGKVPHDRVLAYYGLIDVFVVPRTGARVCQLVTPLKPYEAMATARALVVSDVRALREMVVPEETGLLFRAEDAVDLAAVIDPLLDDPERRTELGRAAREWVCAHHTWERNGQRYLELYRSLGVA